ncbi:MAG: hypothetical protein ACFB16_00200 [Phormidesmis sp.]
MGLFEFVFGKSAPKDDTAPKQAYYLSDDDAKTFGNIDYMRSTKVVKRTFAKKKGETEHMESVRQISATTAQSLDGNGYQAPKQPTPTFGSYAAPAPQPATNAVEASAPVEAPKTESTPKPAPTPASAPRRSASSDMDMFRNMAKDIRK